MHAAVVLLRCCKIRLAIATASYVLGRQMHFGDYFVNSALGVTANVADVEFCGWSECKRACVRVVGVTLVDTCVLVLLHNTNALSHR
mgnify:CR=1 FL=1